MDHSFAKIRVLYFIENEIQITKNFQGSYRLYGMTSGGLKTCGKSHNGKYMPGIYANVPHGEFFCSKFKH